MQKKDTAIDVEIHPISAEMDEMGVIITTSLTKYGYGGQSITKQMCR